MARLTDDADYDAGETFDNVSSPLSDAGNHDNYYGRRIRTRFAAPDTEETIIFECSQSNSSRPFGMPDYSSLASGPGSTSHHSPFVPLTCSSSFVTASNTSSAPSLSLVPPFPLIPTSYALSNATTPHSTYQLTSGPSVTVNGISSPSQVSIMPAYLHGSVSAGNGVGLSADEDLADRSLQQLLLDEEDYEEDLLLALPLVAGPTSTSTPSSYGTLTGLKMDEFSSCDLPNEVNPNIDGSTVAPSDSIISPVSWSANFSSSGRCCCCNYGYYGSAATTTPVNTVSTCLPGADQVSSAILSAVSIRHSSSDSGNSLSPVSSVRSSQHSPSLSATGSSSMVLRGGGHSTSPTHFATYHRRGSQPATASGIRKALPLPLPLQLPSLIGSSSSSASNDFTHHVANGSGGACPGAANKSPTPLHSSTATITNSYNFPSTMHFCHTCHPCCSRPIHPHVLLQTGSNASSTIGSFLSPSANISSFPSAATLMSCSSCLPLSTFPHSRTPAHSFGTPLLSPSVIGGSCYPPQIQLATLIKLVERLTYPAYFDSSMVNSFLMSFRRFTSPEDLLDLLIERFHVPDPEFSPDEWRVDLARGRLEPPAHYMLKRFRTGYKRRVQARVMMVLSRWVRSQRYYPVDFADNQTLRSRLLDFLGDIQSRELATSVRSLENYLMLMEVSAAADVSPLHHSYSISFSPFSSQNITLSDHSCIGSLGDSAPIVRLRLIEVS